MGKAIRNLIAGKVDVRGIGYLANVAVDFVAGMPVRGLRLTETAPSRFVRSLSLRLALLVRAGRAATAPCCLQPAVAGAMRMLEPTSSGTARSRWHERLGRPRSAIRVGRF
jgi:hypothetical protein